MFTEINSVTYNNIQWYENIKMKKFLLSFNEYFIWQLT